MDIILFFGFVSISAVIFLLDRYFKVKKLNKQTVQIIRFKQKGCIHPLVKSLKFSSSVKNSLRDSLKFTKKEGAVLGGFSGMSLLDIYTATNKHQEVLQTIEKRFPKEMEDANSFIWIKKIKQLKKNNSNQSYINAYTGEQAELESMDKLKELGYDNVSQFKSKTHPRNDLTAIDSEGNEVHFSVKSLKSIEDFQKEITEHPDSKNYIVNSELYQNMENSGQLVDYENKGLHIIDGDFSHTEHITEASTAFADLEESVDVSDEIPLIAIAALGYKTINNIIDFKKKKQSKKELGINITMDTAGIGVRSVGALGGAKVGAIAGTLFGPVGTFAGGIAGAVGGCIATSRIMKDVKEKWKWGNIIKAIDYYGEIYYHLFSTDRKNFFKESLFKNIISQNIYNKIYNGPQVLENLKREKRIYKSNSRFLARWSLIPRNFKETLILEHIKALKKYLGNTRLATIKSFETLQDILNNIKIKLPENEKEIRIKRYVGELVIENKEIFIEMQSAEEDELLTEYEIQKEECPNHPYKIAVNSGKYFERILWKTLKELSA